MDGAYARKQSVHKAAGSARVEEPVGEPEDHYPERGAISA